MLQSQATVWRPQSFPTCGFLHSVVKLIFLKRIVVFFCFFIVLNFTQNCKTGQSAYFAKHTNFFTLSVQIIQTIQYRDMWSSPSLPWLRYSSCFFFSSSCFRLCSSTASCLLFSASAARSSLVKNFGYNSERE